MHFLLFGTALTLAAAAVASGPWTRWRRTACRRSGRRGGHCGGRSGRRALRESARTAAWSRGTAACPVPAGWGWCRSSWGSSWAWPWAAAASQTPAGGDRERQTDTLLSTVTLGPLGLIPDSHPTCVRLARTTQTRGRSDSRDRPTSCPLPQCSRCSRTGWSPTAPGWCWGSGSDP